MPSLFNNQYSRGPLYQYWRERGQEEQTLRDQRVQEAKLRSRGTQPLTPAFGPSSNDAYANRATSGPPAYRSENDDEPTATAGLTENEQNDNDATRQGLERETLPTYRDTTITNTNTASHEDRLPGVEEEKARLAQFEARQRQIASDAATARALSNESDSESESDGQNEESQGQSKGGKGKGKRPEQPRRKSTAGKIGRWLADAASGYTKKQERW